MKRFFIITLALLIGSPVLFAHAADVPFLMNYQGSVKTSGGTPYNGNGYFKFAFVNSTSIADPPTYWSNDDTSTSGSEPTDAITIPVSNGLFSVKFGDNSFTNMTTLQSTIFDEPYMSVRTWFSDDNVTFTALSPDQRIVSGAYAIKASVANNVVYSPAKTSYLSFNPSGFLPCNDTYDWSSNWARISHDGIGSLCLLGNINLPHGATVVSVEFNIYDADAGLDLTSFSLRRTTDTDGSSAMASGTSTGSAGWQAITDNTISLATIDNQNYAYILYAFLPASTTIRVGNVHIEYTITSP